VNTVSTTSRDRIPAPATVPHGRGRGVKPERRHWRRSPLDTVVVVTQLDKGGTPRDSWSCRTRDIGRGGIGLVSRRMVHENQRVLVRIATGHQKEPRVLSGVVRHSGYRQGVGYVLGIAFAPVRLPVGG